MKMKYLYIIILIATFTGCNDGDKKNATSSSLSANEQVDNLFAEWDNDHSPERPLLLLKKEGLFIRKVMEWPILKMT